LPDPTTTLVLLTLIVTFGYALVCAVLPFHACRRCQGTGRLPGRLVGLRPCRRCRGTGLRLRLGRRLLNEARDLYRR
jgi:hypothetical protein